MRVSSLVVGLVLCLSTALSAQYYQTDFPADEFRARHARVFEQIGTNAVAVVQGMPQTEGYTLPRQHNTFYYLSGIETPGAYLLLDGRTKQAMLYWHPRRRRGGRGCRGRYQCSRRPMMEYMRQRIAGMAC